MTMSHTQDTPAARAGINRSGATPLVGIAAIALPVLCLVFNVVEVAQGGFSTLRL